MSHMHLPVISHKGSGGTSMKRQKENRIKFLETILESCLVLRQDLACPCLLSAKITGMNTPGASLSFFCLNIYPWQVLNSDPSASASQILGSKECATTMPSPISEGGFVFILLLTIQTA